MKMSVLIEFLDLLSENGIYAFTNGMIRNIFPGEPEENLKKTLSRAVAARLIERACRGVYLYARADSANAYRIESVAAALRGGKYSYVSLETALSEYGIISHMTLGHLTVMTTGRSQKYATPHGTIEFTHTSRSESEIVRNTYWQDGRPLRVANPETAFEDLKRVGRNIHMVDMETYDFLTTGSFSLRFEKIHEIGLEKAVISEEQAKVKATREIRHSYVSRIEFLREEAAEESINFNENSMRDFWKFIETIPFARRGRLFMMDNGDLRVVWDDNEDNLVGIQFLGDSSARYVIFKRRTESGFVSRVAGSDTLNGLISQIKAFKLEALLSA